MSHSLFGQQAKAGPSRQQVGDVLGMSAIFILTGDREGKYVYLSQSMYDILGYHPEELIGRSCYMTFHPDEIPVLLEVHQRSLYEEYSACVTYMRLLHKDGHYLPCAVSYSTVLDRSVGTITRAEYGPLTIKQAMTAREVNEVRPTSGGKFTVRKWPQKLGSPSRSPSPATPASPQLVNDLNQPWAKPPDPLARTAFLIDRFTDTCRILFVTNDVIVQTRGLKDQSFYSIVKPSDRSLVREYIENAKSWSPVYHTERRSGGYGYAEFSVLKIPDLPPSNELYPQGTDESERHMPGQGFMLVEGIFMAGSDGVICVIEKLDRRKKKRDRDRNENEEGDERGSKGREEGSVGGDGEVKDEGEAVAGSNTETARTGTEDPQGEMGQDTEVTEKKTSSGSEKTESTLSER